MINEYGHAVRLRRPHPSKIVSMLKTVSPTFGGVILKQVQKFRMDERAQRPNIMRPLYTGDKNDEEFFLPSS